MTRAVWTVLACKDCALPLPRQLGRQGRQVERCRECHARHNRTYQRDYKRAMRAKAREAARPEYPPEDCQGCGRPMKHGAGGKCAECLAR
jgi:hypothetical protein